MLPITSSNTVATSHPAAIDPPRKETGSRKGVVFARVVEQLTHPRHISPLTRLAAAGRFFSTIIDNSSVWKELAKRISYPFSNEKEKNDYFLRWSPLDHKSFVIMHHLRERELKRGIAAGFKNDHPSFLIANHRIVQWEQLSHSLAFHRLSGRAKTWQEEGWASLKAGLILTQEELSSLKPVAFFPYAGGFICASELGLIHYQARESWIAVEKLIRWSDIDPSIEFSQSSKDMLKIIGDWAFLQMTTQSAVQFYINDPSKRYVFALESASHPVPEEYCQELLNVCAVGDQGVILGLGAFVNDTSHLNSIAYWPIGTDKPRWTERLPFEGTPNSFVQLLQADISEDHKSFFISYSQPQNAPHSVLEKRSVADGTLEKNHPFSNKATPLVKDAGLDDIYSLKDGRHVLYSNGCSTVVMDYNGKKTRWIYEDLCSSNGNTQVKDVSETDNDSDDSSQESNESSQKEKNQMIAFGVPRPGCYYKVCQNTAGELTLQLVDVNTLAPNMWRTDISEVEKDDTERHQYDKGFELWDMATYPDYVQISRRDSAMNHNTLFFFFPYDLKNATVVRGAMLNKIRQKVRQEEREQAEKPSKKAKIG